MSYGSSSCRESASWITLLAAYGFPGNTSDYFRQIGRITGYEREFASAFASPALEEGTDVMAATVAHLFDNEEAVSLWMTEVFVQQFEESVGKSMGADQDLVEVERIMTSGFHDEAVGLRAVQNGPEGMVSSTVIDFRVGRLLGVAFVVTLGDWGRQALTERLASELERQMVQRALSSD